MAAVAARAPRIDPLLLNIAAHAQYEGIPRGQLGRRAGDIRCSPVHGLALIYLRLSDTVISVGAVIIPQVVHRRESKATLPEE